MRHRRKGRILGRSPSHQRALLRNLASALMLTEREFDPGEPGAPKVPGRSAEQHDIGSNHDSNDRPECPWKLYDEK